MSAVDDYLAMHKQAFHSVATYTLYSNTKPAGAPPAGVETVIRTGLSYDVAKSLADELAKPFFGMSSWITPLFNLRLENKEAARGAVRNANLNFTGKS